MIEIIVIWIIAFPMYINSCAIGSEYTILEGSVPAEIIGYARSDTDYDTNIDFSAECRPPSYWYKTNRFIFSLFGDPWNHKIPENSYTLNRQNMQSISRDASLMNDFMLVVYNTFEGCVVSLQFMPDLNGGILNLKYSIHTIKTHMNEQNLPITEFFSNYNIHQTILSSSIDTYQEIYGVPCSSGRLHFVKAINKFVYFQRNKDNAIYWIVLNNQLDTTNPVINACNTNYKSNATISIIRYPITLPSFTKTDCGNEFLSDVDPESAVIYGKFVYYFVTIIYYRNPACIMKNSAGSLHVMDLLTGVNKIVVPTAFNSGIFGQYLGTISDFGIAITLINTLGFYTVSINSFSGVANTVFSRQDSTSKWKFLQTRLGEDGTRPLYGVSQLRKNVLQRITTSIDDVFAMAGQNFYDYQTDIGSLHLLVVYPGLNCFNPVPESNDIYHKKTIIIKIATGTIFKCRVDIASCDSDIGN